MPPKQKITYILPEYREATGTHLYYNYEFLSHAKEILNIFLVIEKGDTPVGFPRAYRMLFRFWLFRAIELFCVLLFARMRGV